MKRILLASLCCLLAMATMYVIPADYAISFTAQLSGNLSPKESVPKIFELKWLEELRAKESLKNFLTPLKCSLSKQSPTEPGALWIDCQLSGAKRTSAKEVEQTLNRLKNTLGWIKKENLKDKLDSLSQTIQSNQETIAQIDSELSSLIPGDKKLKKLFDSFLLSLDSTQRDIDNKKAQLAMVQEALPLQSDETKAQFLQKETEIKNAITSLNTMYEETEKKLIEEGFAYERLKALKMKRKEMETLSEDTMQHMVKIGAILDAHAHSSKVPDPERFQLLGSMKITSTGVQGMQTFFWSPFLGMFLFALCFLTPFSRLKNLQPPVKKGTYLDIHQLEQRLKAPYLGTLDLRHKEDKGQNQPNFEA